MNKLAEKVAARWFSAKAVPMGKTEEKGKIRVHRYRDQLRVWDLTNAGKRGKKVRSLYVGTTYAFNKGKNEFGGDDQKFLDFASGLAMAAGNYDHFVAVLGDWAEEHPGQVNTSETMERGIDHLPAGSKTYKIQWTMGTTELELEATPLEFRVRSSVLMEPSERLLRRNPNAQPFRQDTGYWPAKKADAKKFYGWLATGGEGKIKRMDINDLKKLWGQLKVRYDSH